MVGRAAFKTFLKIMAILLIFVVAAGSFLFFQNGGIMQLAFKQDATKAFNTFSAAITEFNSKTSHEFTVKTRQSEYGNEYSTHATVKLVEYTENNVRKFSYSAHVIKVTTANMTHPEYVGTVVTDIVYDDGIIYFSIGETKSKVSDNSENTLSQLVGGDVIMIVNPIEISEITLESFELAPTAFAFSFSPFYLGVGMTTEEGVGTTQVVHRTLDLSMSGNVKNQILTISTLQGNDNQSYLISVGYSKINTNHTRETIVPVGIAADETYVSMDE